jgi:hypothetical protein
MAQDDNDPDVALVEGMEDNAKALTSGIVILTTVLLLAALIVMQKALGHWFNIGMFA